MRQCCLSNQKQAIYHPYDPYPEAPVVDTVLIEPSAQRVTWASSSPLTDPNRQIHEPIGDFHGIDFHLP